MKNKLFVVRFLGRKLRREQSGVHETRWHVGSKFLSAASSGRRRGDPNEKYPRTAARAKKYFAERITAGSAKFLEPAGSLSLVKMSAVRCSARPPAAGKTG